MKPFFKHCLIALFSMFSLYFLSLNILPLFSMIKFDFVIYDPLITTLLVLITFYASNKSTKITIIFASILSFSIFLIQPVGLSVQNVPLTFFDFFVFYPTLMKISPLYFNIILTLITILYLGLLFLCFFMFIKHFIIFLKNKNRQAIFLPLFILVIYLSFFRAGNMQIWALDFPNIANKYGFINAINSRVKYDKMNTDKISKEEVKNALLLLRKKEANRDISSLITKTTLEKQDKKRDVFIIFLESFYDYSHFVSLFDKDPFNQEYRNWANKSAKIGPNTSSGSFFARLVGLTASSPLYPKGQTSSMEGSLPDIMNKNEYNTVAIEEYATTYNLDNFLPSIGFSETTFNIGTANLSSYIKENITNMQSPLFLYAFTYLGHHGSGTEYRAEYSNDIVNNASRFIDQFQKKDKDLINAIFSTSLKVADEIIKTRDIILAESPDALIIFKHDHLHPSLPPIIVASEIDEAMKSTFLNSPTPSPILIWDGQNGAYKLPEGFAPENIPLFIAVNANLKEETYKGTPISLLYKDTHEGFTRFYKNIYKIENNNVIDADINEMEIAELIEYEKAESILSRDIFRGKKYFYKNREELN